MFRIKNLTVVLASALLLANVAVSRADFLTSHLQFGVENVLSDTSLEVVTKGDGNTGNFIQAGDILTGVIQFQEVGPTNNTTNIASNFSGEITGTFQIQFTGTPSTGINGLPFAPTAAFQAQYGTGAVAAIFENDAGRPLAAQIAAGGGNVGDYVTAASAGTFLASIGLPGTSNGEVFNGQANSIALPPPSNLTGSYQGSLDLVKQSSALSSVIFSFLEPSFNTGMNNVQFSVTGTQKFNLNFGLGTSPFPIADVTQDFFVPLAAPVPEPSSCLLLGIGGATLVFFRKRSKKAIA